MNYETFNSATQLSISLSASFRFVSLMRDGELGAEEAGRIYDAAALLSRLFVLFLFGSGEGVHDDLSVRV